MNNQENNNVKPPAVPAPKFSSNSAGAGSKSSSLAVSYLGYDFIAGWLLTNDGAASYSVSPLSTPTTDATEQSTSRAKLPYSHGVTHGVPTQTNPSDGQVQALADVGIEIDGVTYIFGTEEDNVIEGTDGNDQIVGDSGENAIAGNDTINGGLGDDSIWGDGVYDNEGNLLDDVGGNDVIDGGEGADKIAGGAGDDIINGGVGDDTLWGEAGNDQLFGDAGNDIIVGGSGIDTIDGGADNDSAWGGEGADIMDGGAGDDILRGDDDADDINGGDGNDTIWGDSYSLDDALHAGDFIEGGAGDDLIAGGGGNDELLGQQGNDTIWGDEGGAYGTIHGDDEIRGGDGNDYLIGEGGNDIIYGDGGNDTLRGDASYLPGIRHGNDELYGGDGDDKLMGGAGDDLLVGGAGSNEYQFSKGSDDDRIELTAGASDVIQLGTGIDQSDVEFIREYNPNPSDPRQGYSDDFFIDFSGEGGTIFFDGLFASSDPEAIEEIRFADGTVILYDEFTNSAPIIYQDIADFGHLEDDNLNLDVSNVFFDIDNDDLTLTLTSPDSALLFEWATFDGNSLSGTPLNEHVGFYEITLSAFDGYESVSTTFELEVINTNDEPEVGNPIPNQSATEDTAFSFTFNSNTFFDVDVGDSLTYSAGTDGGGGLPSWLSFNAGSRRFSGTPTNSDVGTVDIAVTATDTEGASVTDVFSIVVANVNDAPDVGTGVGDVQTNEGASFSYTVPSDAFNDVDGDTLTYSASLVGGGSLPSWLGFNGSNATFSGTPRNDDVGLINIRVTATDGSGSSASDDFSLEVLNTNDAPVVDQGIDNVSALEDSSFNYTVPGDAFEDVDGDTLSYTAELSGGGSLPSWLSFNGSSGAFSGTPTNADTGTINIIVTARDPSGAAASDSFSIEVVNTADSPEVSNPIADMSTNEDAAFSFTFAADTFTDGDGDTLTYSAQLASGAALPAWLSFNSGSRNFSGTPTNDDVGTLNIQVTASDGGSSVSDSFLLEIINVNDPPEVDAGIPDFDMTPGESFLYSIPANAFSDDQGIVEYTAQVSGQPLPTWLQFDGESFSALGEDILPEYEGTVVTVGAYDGQYLALTDFILI